MKKVKTKICGLTRPEDAAFCAAQGADFLGLIFAPSPRRISLGQGREIRAACGRVPLVGVFVDALLEEVLNTIEALPLELVQLHGKEDDAYCEEIRRRSAAKIIRAFSAGQPAGPPQIGLADYHLIDLDKSLPRGERDAARIELWAEAARLAQDGEHPLILAGALTPANVGEAVAKVKPFAVDVASGVESEPGIKDLALVASFLKEVRECTANHR